jgi:GAF domain-containing protein
LPLDDTDRSLLNEHSAHIAAALTEAAKMVNSPRTLDETLDAIVRAALQTVPGFNHVGISITHRNGEIETRAGTDPLVWELDEIQYSLQEGPCFDSIRGSSMRIVENARHDQRWPRYMPQAVRKGLRAQLAVGLYTDDDTLGGLNLYSTESDIIDPDAVQAAELFASHAAIALGRSRIESQLNEALSSRKTIGQAIGILMERYQIDQDRAFQFLIRASSTANIKLRDVAEELVVTSNERFTKNG